MFLKNKWRTAFFALVALLVICFGVLFAKVTAPVSTPAETTASSTTDPTLEVTMNRKQVNALSANYLNRFLKDS